MKKEGLGKLYDRLTGEERFKLVIEALARGDEEEAKRLADSCPHGTHRMRELAFTDPYKVSMVVTVGLCLDLAPLLVSLGTVEALRETLPLAHNLHEDRAILAYLEGHKTGSKHTWKATGKTGDPSGWKKGDEADGDRAIEEDLQRITDHFEDAREGLVSSLQELERDIASEALTIWQAFATFSEEKLSVQPEKLVEVWFEPMLPEIEKLKIPSDLQVDPEELKEYRATLAQVWSKLVRSS